MNPVEQQKTVFACGTCKTVYGARDQAESCCLCEACGKRPATAKEHSFSRMSFCEQCAAAKARKQARDACEHARKSVAEYQERLARARAELEKAEAVYAALGGKRREIAWEK